MEDIQAASKSTVARAAERTVVAGLLVALVTGPLYFNELTSRIFEPDKILVIQLVGLTVAMALIVRWLAGRSTLLSLPSNLGLLAAGLSVLVLSAILSTILSVAPDISLFGSFERMQGLLAFLTYLVFFLGAALILRTRTQLERLLSTVILTSIPVGLYGIAQRLGLDPILWDIDVADRVATTMGNPAFAAGYLAMAVPLTLAVWFANRRSPARLVCTAAVIIQIACILLTQSRAAFLALLLGLFVFGMLSFLSAGRLKFARMLMAAGFAAVTLLWTIQQPVPGPQSEGGGLHRLTRLVDTRTGTGRVRILIWTGVERLIAANPTRALIGYGPDTIKFVLPPHTPPELESRTRGARADRGHSHTYDVLMTTGFTGLLGWLLVVTALVILGLRMLGIVASTIDLGRILSFWLGGALLAGVAAVTFDGGWRMVGPAASLGLVAGLCGFLGWGAFRGRDHEAAGPETVTEHERAMTALTAAVVASIVLHFAEIQIGLAVTATTSLFWILTGCLVGLSYRPQEAGSRFSVRLPLWGIATGWALASIAYPLILSTRPLGNRFVGIGLLAASWAGAALLQPPSNQQDSSRFWLWSASIAFGLVVLRLLTLELDGTKASTAALCPAAAVAVVLLGGYGVAGKQGGPAWSPTAPIPRRRRLPILATSTVFAAVLIAAWLETVSWIRADAAMHESVLAGARGDSNRMIESARRATILDPSRAEYFLNLGRAHVQAGDFVRAEAVLVAAASQNPLDVDHFANLGRLYQQWWKSDPESPSAKGYAERAVERFETATKMIPASAFLLYELGVASLMAGDTTAALSAFEESRRLNPDMRAAMEASKAQSRQEAARNDPK